MTILQKHLERLRGQTAWITGARRIGRTIAQLLAEQGVNLVVSYRHSEKEARETVSAACAAGVKAIPIYADVSSFESVRSAVERVSQEFPQINILANMASIYRQVPIEAVTQADWEANFAAHVLGTFYPTQLIVRLMPPGSHIINVADITSIGKVQKMSLPYIATKSAVASMTRVMALEYGARGLFVNAIAPGPILPPEDFPKDVWQRIRERSAVKFPVTDEEAVDQFALLVLYLSMTTMTSGQIYPLDQAQNV